MRIYLLFLVTSLTFFLIWASVDADELLESEQELIAWLDSLGYQDLSEAPIVKVATGEWVQIGNGPKQNHFKIGFLIAENETEFSIIDLSGEKTTHVVKTGTVEDFEAVYFDPLDLVEVAKKQIRDAEEVDSDDHWRRFGSMTTESFETVFFARACAAQGYNKIAHELFELARQQLKQENRGEPTSLINFLKKDQAHTRMWRAVLAFETPEISRPELHRKFQHLIDHFPESKHVSRARETAKLLKRMIEEDEEHANREIPPLDELTGDALVAELIYQLRTQNGRQWSQPGACNIFNDERGDDSPAERLVALGFDAVPQLIEVLDDQRFTRSVGYHRDFYFSHHVLRVGDCAEHILRRIAGRHFYSRNYTNGAMVKDGEAKTIKEEVEAWWKEVQSKGEKQVLIEAVSSGDENASNQATLLATKYPDSAIDAIQKGLANSKRDWNSQRLIALLAKLGSEEALEVVNQQLANGRTLPIRIEAARALLENGQTESAIQRMIGEWNDYSPPKKQEVSHNDPQTQLAILLIRSGSSTAVKAVADDFTKINEDNMDKVIRSLVYQELDNTEETYQKAVEAFLIDCLQLTNEVNISGSYGDQVFSQPRVCDFAGYVLTLHWPESYNCRIDGTERERDESRFAAINHWRNANELEPIKVPKPFVIKPASKEITDPLVEAVVTNKSADSVESALNQLEELGPIAIDAIKQIVEKTDDSHPFATDIRQALADVANTITVIKFDESPVEIEQAWRQKFEQLKGQTLSGEIFMSTLADFVNDQPCPGIRVKAVREDISNGIKLSVEWIGEPADRSGTQQMWNYKQSVKLGRQSSQSTIGSISVESATDSNSLGNLKEPIDEALRSSEQSMSATVSLVIDK